MPFPTDRGRPIAGFTFLPLTFLAIVLGSLTLLLVHVSLAEKDAVDLEDARIRALQVAEVGLTRAEMEIVSGTDADGDGLGTLTGSFAGGLYQVDATVVDATKKIYALRADGEWNSASRRLEEGCRVATQSIWQWALFSKTSLSMTGGSWTDAYDSRKGTYLSQVVNGDAVGPYASLGGSIGSNADLTVGGGAVRGDARCGPLYLPTFSGGTIVYGDTTPFPEEQVIPDPPYDDFLAAYTKNDNLGIDTSNPKVSYDPVNLVLLSGGGAPITLPGGTYIFNTLKMTGGGTLTIQGPSKIYITNHFEVSGGGIVNLSGKPADCQIIAAPYDFPAGSKHDKLKVITSGGSGTALAVYAPAFHFECSGGGDLWGSAVADTIVLSGGSGFHYDQELADEDMGASGGKVQRLYWAEVTTPPRS